MTLATLPVSTWPKSGSIRQWARITGYSPTTFYIYFREGKLKGHKRLNGHVVIIKEDICEFLNRTKR